MSTPNPQAPPAQAAPAMTAEEIAAIKAENAALKGSVDETKRAAQFWYEKANAGTPAPAKPATAGDEEEEDVLDLITSKGSKGLEKLLAKKGFVRAADVEKTVEERAGQITREAELISTYPDLKNPKSEFFKEVATEYGRLVNAGIPKTMAMEQAAKNVELEGIHSGTRKSRKQIEADDAATREAERLARISAQSGNRGGGGGSEDESEDLTPEQRRIAISMLAGNGVSEEDAIKAYQKRAKAGVAMRGGR